MTMLLLALLLQTGPPRTDYGVGPLQISDELTSVANDIIFQQGLPYAAVVLIPEKWRDDGVVTAATYVRGNGIEILVSPLMIEDMDAEGLRAVLAHELAHTQIPCNPDPLSNEAESVACEHRVDALSAKWVGKKASLRALCQVMASVWYWRYMTDVWPLIERIRLLHNRTDVPYEAPARQHP